MKSDLKFLRANVDKIQRPIIAFSEGNKERAVFKRRQFPRVSKEYRVSYSLVDQEQFDCRPFNSLAVNISGGGICFTVAEPLAKGSMVALDIDADDLQSSILALAKIRWCKAQGKAYEVGADFWWIGWRDNDAQHTVADFITAKTAAQRLTTLP